VKINPIGASSVTELIAGIVDCQLAFAVNEPITLRKAGIEPVIFNLADYGFGGQGEVYITRREYFEKHQDVLVRFLQATARAWEVYLDDPEGAAAWIVKAALVDGLDVTQQKAQAALMADLIADDFTKEHGLLYLNDELWQLQARQALDQGRVSKLPVLDTARSYAILDAAKLAKR
jgi:ABC-type nitrate/sulfonate/bicarbonate transport system substrate-binding protein